MKKYELEKQQSMEVGGRTLYRIRALKDFETADGEIVKAGALGGWVESEKNLSQDGSAWVGGTAQVVGDSRVMGSALVKDAATVSGKCTVKEKAVVCDQAVVFGSVTVSDMAQVSGGSRLAGNAKICGTAKISGWARVNNNALICDAAYVAGSAKIFGEAKISGTAHIVGFAQVGWDAEVGGDAVISGGGVGIWGARIKGRRDVLVIDHPIGDSHSLTFCKNKNGGISAVCDEFPGKIDVDAFLEAVEKEHGDNAHGRAYRAAAELAKIVMEGEVGELSLKRE